MIPCRYNSRLAMRYRQCTFISIGFELDGSEPLTFDVQPHPGLNSDVVLPSRFD